MPLAMPSLALVVNCFLQVAMSLDLGAKEKPVDPRGAFSFLMVKNHQTVDIARRKKNCHRLVGPRGPKSPDND